MQNKVVFRHTDYSGNLFLLDTYTYPTCALYKAVFERKKTTLRCLVPVVPEGQAQTTSTLYRTPAALPLSPLSEHCTGYYIQHRRHWTVDQALGEVTKKCFRCRGRCPWATNRIPGWCGLGHGATRQSCSSRALIRGMMRP